MKAALAVLLVALAGCVERTLRIESDPPGAAVWVDGEARGVTPVIVPFVWYGDREILLEKPGYRSLRKIEEIAAPWWQIFPFDFITDVLVPFPIRDARELRYALEPERYGPEAFEETKKRAEDLRRKSAAREP